MVNLTYYENIVLEKLKTTPGVAVTKDELHNALYGDLPPRSNCLQTFIVRLRKKGHNIQGIRGVGYMFRGSADRASTFPTKADLEKEGLA